MSRATALVYFGLLAVIAFGGWQIFLNALPHEERAGFDGHLLAYALIIFALCIQGAIQILGVLK